MAENILIGPTSHIEARAGREKFKASLRHFKAAFTFQTWHQNIAQAVQKTHIGCSIFALRIAQLVGAPIAGLLLLGDGFAQHLVQQVLKAMPISIGAGHLAGDLGAENRCGNYAEVIFNRCQIKAGVVIDFHTVRISQNGFEIGRIITAALGEAHEVLVTIAIADLDNAQPIAVGDEAHRLCVYCYIAIGQHAFGQVFFVIIYAHSSPLGRLAAYDNGHKAPSALPRTILRKRPFTAKRDGGMTLRKLIDRAWRYKGRLAVIGALGLGSSVALLALPALVGALLGGVVDQTQIATGWLLTALVCALAATSGLTLASSILTASTTAQILADMRAEVFAHITRLPMSFHDDSRQGDVLALAVFEVGRLSSFLTSTLAQLPAMIATAVGATVMMFLIDPVLALVIPLLIPVFYVVLKLVSRQLRGIAKDARAAEAEVFSVGESNLSMLPVTKAFATEETDNARYDEALDHSRAMTTRMQVKSAPIAPVANFIAGAVAIGVIVLAGNRLGSDQTSVTELFSFLLYAALLTRPVGALSNFYGQWQMARGTLARMEDVLAQPAEPGHGTGEKLAEAKGAIAFDRVSFAYPGRPAVLKETSLSVPAGQIVAIVGNNGCGKSTMMKLLLRLYEPEAGRILLDGTDIASIDVQSLRRQIGYVPQRPMLRNGTIRQNVLAGVSTEDEEALENVLALTQSSAFIADLPDGLDTLIGDHGVRLSGGQGQRLCLARAILPDPPVLVLDEATSMWDTGSEAKFLESFGQALQNRTTFLVTHRPASLALADRIVRVENGVCHEMKRGAELDRLLAAEADTPDYLA